MEASAKKPGVLIVDDDPSVTVSLSLLLKNNGYRPIVAHTPDRALASLREERVEAVLQDMNFSRKTTGEEGLNLLADIRAEQPQVPVILMTAWGSIALAVKGIKAGALDFLTKPWQNDQVLRLLETARELAAGTTDPAEPSSRESLDQRFDFSRIVGASDSLLRILATIGRVAHTDASVLILGESGTGKELIADAIHRNSKRARGPFVKVNLGGIAASLFESEMFGHLRGAFTDAVSDRKGRFTQAHGGSIFLDEIGDLDPGSQVKMLRVLQDRRYEVLGSSRTISVDTRVVSATNRNLDAMVREGSFREDLFYRLNLITLELPPLRERPEDIPLLVNHFLGHLAQSYGLERPQVAPAAMKMLQRHAWPGNIRHLKQVLERALLISGKDMLEPEDFRQHQTGPATETPTDVLPPVGDMTLEEIEKAMILKSLKHFEGNVTKVASSLGISRAALYRRFEKHGICP